jgi:hypothetical protein
MVGAGATADAGARRQVRIVIARVATWVVLYALALRYAGGAIAVWAGGTLTVVGTILIGVVAPVWLFVLAPTWLAWRVAVPLGLHRLALLACWLSPLVRARDLGSIRVFLDAIAGRPLAPLASVRADAWTALAMAVIARRRGDTAEVARITDALLHLPAGARLPRLARVHGLAALADPGAPESRPSSISVVSLAGVSPPPAPREPVERTTPAADPRRAHLDLLAAAANGPPIERRRVLLLAVRWQSAFDDAPIAALRARALELGVRDGAARARALRDDVLDELTDLAVDATGGWGAVPTADGLPAKLAARVRDRLHRRVDSALARFGRDPREPAPAVLDTWRRWLVLRAALDELELAGGLPALTTVWYGGLRDAVWSTACALHTDRAHGGPWVAHAMFTWVADRGEMLGDLPATLLNRENARSAAVGL